MTTEQSLTEQSQDDPMMMHQMHRHMHHEHHGPPQGNVSSPIYGLGMIGAWVFYFRHVTTFQDGVFAFFKGLFWPAFMVYDLLVFLKKE